MFSPEMMKFLINYQKDDFKPEQFKKFVHNNHYPLNDEYILILKDGVQYGPYIHYELGKYLIIYNGDGLLNGDYDCVDTNYTFPIKILEKSQSKIIYQVDISQKLGYLIKKMILFLLKV